MKWECAGFAEVIFSSSFGYDGPVYISVNIFSWVYITEWSIIYSSYLSIHKILCDCVIACECLIAHTI